MPSLLIEHAGSRQAGLLAGRVLIGRWPKNGIIVDHSAVSRIHAWVGAEGGRFYIADAASRTGTFVNGQTIAARHVLEDGDEIRVGPATLTYFAQDQDVEGLPRIDLSPREAAGKSDDRGTMLDCACGAPLWIPRAFSGVGQCRYCHRAIDFSQVEALPVAPRGVPPVAPSVAPPKPKKAAAPTPAARSPASSPVPIQSGRAPASPAANGTPAANGAVTTVRPNAPAGKLPARPPAPMRRIPLAPAPRPIVPLPAARVTPLHPASARPAVEHVCGICHAPVTHSEQTTRCPSCGLAFHADCWNDNLGCSAYGCSQVGALARQAGHGEVR